MSKLSRLTRFQVMLACLIGVGGGDVPGTGYEVRWVAGVPVVSAPGEIDVTNVCGLRDAIRSCTNAEGATLVVDMSETTFCDSAGMNQIVRAHQRAVAASGELRLVVGSASVMRILAIVGIDRMLPIYTSLDEALVEASAPSRLT
jgi:anti-anti-sigma factor